MIHYRNQVAVLTYHDIGEAESAYTITPARFEAHLAALQKNGYTVIPVEALHGFIILKRPVPDNALVITFDDGYASFYRYAYPLLRKQRMTAANFLIVGYVNASAPGYLTWQQLLEMRAAGFGFYSHSYLSHEPREGYHGRMVNPLTEKIYNQQKNRMETWAEQEQRVAFDLLSAETHLKRHLGNRISMLSFPHGLYTDSLIRIGMEVGISLFFTGQEGLNTNVNRLIRRINAGSSWVTAESLLASLNAFRSKSY